MQVILLERIEKLGQMGDVVNVKPGYARNFLLPQRKAMRATAENVKRFEGQRVELEATNLERRAEAEAVAEKLDGLTCVLLRQASESAQLYGSVTARDIADAIGEGGARIRRAQVQLERPIKTLGIHSVRVALHPEVTVGVNVNVARSAEEAEARAAGAARGETPGEAGEAPADDTVADEAKESASEENAGETGGETGGGAAGDDKAGAAGNDKAGPAGDA